MRYWFLGMALLGDVALIVCTGVVLWYAPTNPIIWLFVLLAWRANYKTGGLGIWRPSEVREYLRRAKEVGL